MKISFGRRVLTVLVMVSLLVLAFTNLALAQAKDPELRLAGSWPFPFSGNAFAPEGIGVCWWFAYEPFAYFVPATGEYIPRLATSWEVEENKLIVTLKDAKWSDDTPFTAEDIECAVALIQAVWQSSYAIADIEVIEPLKVAFVLDLVDRPVDSTVIHSILTDAAITSAAPSHIYGQFLEEAKEVAALGREIWVMERKGEEIPEDVEKEFDEKSTAFAEKVFQFNLMKEVGYLPVVGTYEIDKMSQSEMLLKLNENHWAAENIKIPKVSFKRWSSNDFVWASLVAGEIDAAHPSVTKDVVEQHLDAPDSHLQLVTVSDLGEFALIFNHENPLFQDLNLKKAIIYALDRAAVRDIAIWHAIDVSDYAHGILKSMEGAWLDPDFLETLTNYKVDREKAEATLKEAGYTKGSDGLWHTPQGEVVEFTISAYGPYSDWVLAAREIAEQLKAFGFKVDVKIIPDGMQGPTLMAGDYDTAIEFGTSWWGFPHPHTGYSRLYDENGYLAEVTRFPIKEKYNTPWGDLAPYDELIELQQVMDNPEETKEQVKKLAYITNEYLPIMPYLEKVLPIYYIDGENVTGWPEKDDPIWSLAPGAIERLYILLLSEGRLRPVE